MIAVGRALMRDAGMRMDICYHGEPCLAAELPEGSIAASVKNHDAGIETVGIEIILLTNGVSLLNTRYSR